MKMAQVQGPAKRAKLLEEFSSDESEASAPIGSETLKINAEYARRFEYNKKREEKGQLEEKLGKNTSIKRKRDAEDESAGEDSSSDESEDDDAELATADLDEEIMATLQAIKNKDPRVYDAQVKFYRDFDPDADAAKEVKKEKPMYLQDYHRQNLMAGNVGSEEEDQQTRVQTYSEEQDQLKRELVGAMHRTVKEEDGDDDGDFMVARKKPKHENLPAPKGTKKITDDDVKAADHDPEKYLSNFMAARAWLPGDGSRFEAFDSDDSDDDKRAEEFEEAYNMRFEDPQTANEKLQSFARDVGKYGVRRDEKSGRQKARDREREKRDMAKRELEADKARLRNLKIEEAEEKIKRIKEAAGLKGKDVDLEEWRTVIEGDFDDDAWEKEMQRRFGEDYYEQADESGSEGQDNDDQSKKSKSRKSKKPKWDDDIDIGDLVPDFDPGDKPNITLSDLSENDEDGESSKKKKSKKDREKEKREAKRAARVERQKIEDMVDAALPLQMPTLMSTTSSRAPVAGFRYRETSPTSFGLSARDILFADDAQLNQYAGLKKMAAFRDPEKKRRDKKKLSKKARLKQWRRETFGREEEPSGGFETVLGGAAVGGAEDVSGKKQKKRKNKKAKTQPSTSA